MNTASGNSIRRVELGPLDRVGPNTPAVSQVSTWLQPNAVDVQIQAPTDDPNGTGVYYFTVYRNGVFLLQSQSAAFTDASVSPGTSYTYAVYVTDYHNNSASPVSFSVTTPAAGAIDPRQPGVKGTGSHWGAMGEQINMQSGNLNFSLPLVNAQARGGWSAAIGLSYNSQVWRKDTAATWRLGQDVGYGFGWKMMAGSVTPFWANYWNLHHWIFTDATGAEYRLDQNSGGVWTSRDSTYVSYDSNVNRLYFNDGSFWVMDSVSSGAEQDAGTRYPTVMQDSNGNQILLRYKTGLGVTWENSSARLDEVEDVRAVSCGCAPLRYRTYSFSYNTDAIPHLNGIANYINTSEGYSFTYSAGQTLWSPFSGGGSHGTAQMLIGVTMSGLGLTTTLEYGSNAAGELATVRFPYQGEIRWVYRDFTYSGSRTYREVSSRQLLKEAGAAVTTYAITRNDSLDATLSAHSEAVMADPGAVGRRKWLFQTSTASAYFGLVTSYEEQQMPGPVVKSKQDYTWTQDAAQRPYVNAVLNTIDPGQSYQKQSKTEQTLDGYGNLTQMKIYGFGSLVTAAKTYTNYYLTDSNYTSRYIRNRVIQADVTNGTETVSRTASYDTLGVTTPTWGAPVGARQHDGANYSGIFTYRGNAAVTNGPEGFRLHYSDYLGARWRTTDYYGHAVDNATNSGTNYAAPSTVTPNSTSSLATSMGYSSFLGLSSVTGPNGASASVTYDSYARPQGSNSPHGASTAFTYVNSPPSKTATTNGHWTKTSYDGLGRPIKVESGDGTGTKSIVRTDYDSCACSPLGKVKQVSQPYTGASPSQWTVYQYDGLGRVTQVNHPAGSGATKYFYEGNTVKVEDAAGKWKKFETDVFGNLTKVTEPNPVGSPAEVDTTYTYNLQNQLKTVTMVRAGVTQTRTFNYDPQWRLQNETNPETGTVSYYYNLDNTLSHKVDAKNQRIEYVYDGHQRVTQVKRYPVNGGSEDLCQRATYYHDVNPYGSSGDNAVGRVAAVEWGLETGCAAQTGRFTEMYRYTVGGLVTTKTLRLRRLNTILGGYTSADLAATYGHNNEGQMTSMIQPSYYTGTPGSPSFNSGATYTLGYDGMARLKEIRQTAPSSFYPVSNMQYGVGGELTSITYSTGQVQTRQYNALFQMTRMTVSGGAMDFEYRYSAAANNGQITSMKNHISGEDVVYSYDSLKRLTSAVTVGPEWGQGYDYDGFGNLVAKNAIKGSAGSMSVGVNGTNEPADGVEL